MKHLTLREFCSEVLRDARVGVKFGNCGIAPDGADGALIGTTATSRHVRAGHGGAFIPGTVGSAWANGYNSANGASTEHELVLERPIPVLEVATAMEAVGCLFNDTPVRVEPETQAAKFTRVCALLDALIASEADEGEAGDVVRDEADAPWYAMTEEERESFRTEEPPSTH